MENSEQYTRRRYLEPSRMFLRHSLAVSECYVQLVEICRRTPGLTLLTADWEGYYELVVYLMDNRKEYGNFIMTGTAPGLENDDGEM